MGVFICNVTPGSIVNWQDNAVKALNILGIKLRAVSDVWTFKKKEYDRLKVEVFVDVSKKYINVSKQFSNEPRKIPYVHLLLWHFWLWRILY